MPSPGINKTSSGTWRVQVRVTGFRAKSKTFEKLADAERWRRERLSETDIGLDQDTSALGRTSVGDLIRRFIDERLPGRRGARAERHRLLAMLDTDMAQRRLGQDVAAAVKVWVAGRSKVVSGETVRREMALLGAVFTTAIKDWGVALPENPMSRVRRPPGGAARTGKLWDDKSVAALLAAADAAAPTPGTAASYVGPVFRLCLETAMRLREACLLPVECIDAAGGVAVLPANVAKTGVQRPVLLSSGALKAIADILALRGDGPGPLVPHSPDNIGREFRAVRAAAGLDEGDRLWLRDTRHTAITAAAKVFTSPLDLAQFSGHARLDQLKTYYHPAVSSLARRLG